MFKKIEKGLHIMYSCFVICPIGESGSDIRKRANKLRKSIIEPAMEGFGFEVVRGDDLHSEEGQINIEVIQAVRESELCIVDISVPNPNVYYELGLRHESGKPLILLMAKGSGKPPVDIAAHRYIEYDLSTKQGIYEAKYQLKDFVKYEVERGLASASSDISMSKLFEMVRYIYHKIDRIETKIDPEGSGGDIDCFELWSDDMVKFLKHALNGRDISLAEKAMDTLSCRMDKTQWFLQAAGPVAVSGSEKAGRILMGNACAFMDGLSTFHEKTEYLGYLVAYLNQTKSAEENRQLVEDICAALQANSAGEANIDRVQVYYQLYLMYYGIYVDTKVSSWLEKAIETMEQALKISDQFGFLCYYLADCLRKRGREGDKELALKYLLRSGELGREIPDIKYLEMVCELSRELDDPNLPVYESRLKAMCPPLE